jgi:hypothetical protein
MDFYTHINLFQDKICLNKYDFFSFLDQKKLLSGHGMKIKKKAFSSLIL